MASIRYSHVFREPKNMNILWPFVIVIIIFEEHQSRVLDIRERILMCASHRFSVGEHFSQIQIQTVECSFHSNHCRMRTLISSWPHCFSHPYTYIILYIEHNTAGQPHHQYLHNFVDPKYAHTKHAKRNEKPQTHSDPNTFIRTTYYSSKQKSISYGKRKKNFFSSFGIWLLSRC